MKLEELNEFAARFAKQIAPREKSAMVITLSGDLGAGKTTFVQAVAKALGIEESVTSPTFFIQKNYVLPMNDLVGRSFEKLVHIDAYRLESPDELQKLGFRELLTDPGNLILLEWPERVAELIPEDAIQIRFDIHGDERTISINGNQERGKRH